MRNFLLKCISFFLVISIVFTLVTELDNIDNKYQENINIEKLQSRGLNDSLDVLFIGNSYCYSGVDTRYLDSTGKKVYNLGIATAGVKFYDLILQDYLNTAQTFPKRILLLVSPMTFSDMADNFTAYPVHRYLKSPLSHYELYQKHKDFSVKRAYMRSFKKGLRNVFEQLNSNKIEQHVVQRELQSKNLGFYQNWTIRNTKIIQDQHYKMLQLKGESFNQERLRHLLDISKKVENYGIETSFFSVPTGQLNTYFSDEYLSNYIDGLETLSIKNEIIQLDPNGLNNSHYRNIDHLNSYGAKLVTDEIRSLLW